MPKIDGCEANQCAYNRNGQCHALAITVGDSAGPKCDTFLEGGEKGGDPAATGSVGACKVSSCRYNEMLECSAGKIHVARKAGEVDCMTFSKK